MNEDNIITGDNLSEVWASAYLRVGRAKRHEISPLVVRIQMSIAGLPEENKNIKEVLDLALAKAGTRLSADTVAGTIFPKMLWNPHRERSLLFDRFERIWPQLKRCKANKRGTYFRRMTAFRPSESNESVNQLDQIISTWCGGNRRRSALQATIFDPTRDHINSPRLGFPCLQGVAFIPYCGELTVSAYYPMQHIFERGYGNYLGLSHLGMFMAKEMGLRFVSLVCVSGVAARSGGSGLSQIHNDLGAQLRELIRE